MSLLFRTPKIGKIWGVDTYLHWTMWLLPCFILFRGAAVYTVDEMLLQFFLVFGAYACVLLHESLRVFIARRLTLGIRDVTLYPIGGVARYSVVAERPWKEVWVATSGPFAHALLAGVIAIVFVSLSLPLAPRLDTAHPIAETYFNRLFWVNVLLACLQVIPAFPMDGGWMFRGALALSAQRLRATEVATMLSSFVALLVMIPGLVWLSDAWWLILIGIVIHVSGQQELMQVRYFESLRNPLPGTPHGAPIMATADQVIDAAAQPDEPNFSGMIWNPNNRLWVVWQNGEPVSANALVGE